MMNHDSYQDKHFCRHFFKQQLKLAAGLLQLQLTDNQSSHYFNNKNCTNTLYAPNTIISSLLTLFYSNSSDLNDNQKVDLVRCLLNGNGKDCSNKSEAKRMLTRYCTLNNDKMIESSDALYVNHFYYSAVGSNLLSEKLVDKLWCRHSSMAKELYFFNREKTINFGAMKTINWDVDRATHGQFSPMLRNSEYINLLLAIGESSSESMLKTMLVNTANFCWFLSSPFKASSGTFTRADGSLLPGTPFLNRCKYFRYYSDKSTTQCEIVQINCKRANLKLVFILPNRTMSVEHFCRHHLSYRTLKRLFKKLKRSGSCRRRRRVAVRLPRFCLSSNRQLAKPIEALRLREIVFGQVAGSFKGVQKSSFLSPSSSSLDKEVVLLQKAMCELTIRKMEKGDKIRSPNYTGNVTRRRRLRIKVPRLGKMLLGRLRWQLKKRKRPPPVSFTADRPFLFLLLTTGKVRLVQMVGLLEDPSAASVQM